MRSPHATRRLALALVVVFASGCGFHTAILQKGGNGRMGVLLNYSCGAHPCDPIDPSKPTIVFTHGWNPLPGKIRCTFGPSSAAALRCRCGDSYNLLSWDWNGVHVPALGDGPIDTGREQGRMLARALRSRGVIPARTQLIGHSLGNVVISQAAACMADQGRFCQVTLLDPPTDFHEVIFETLCLTHHARHVENYWSPGVSGYGGVAHYRGVRNYQIPSGPHPFIGIVDLGLSNHVYTMMWYYCTIRNPSIDCGFQKSAMRCYCGRRFPGEGDAYDTTQVELPPPLNFDGADDVADVDAGTEARLGYPEVSRGGRSKRLRPDVSADLDVTESGPNEIELLQPVATAAADVTSAGSRKR